MKYTKEVLTSLVKESLSVAEVIKRLGLKNVAGGTHYHISQRIKKFDLDTSHFLGQARNRGTSHQGGPEKVHWTGRLVINRFESGRKEHTPTLRRAMIESGIPHVCGTCGIEPVWRGKALVLQISHKNGQNRDNRKENVHFECPNCHSQTEDFAGNGKGKNFRAPIAQRKEQTASTRSI